MTPEDRRPGGCTVALCAVPGFFLGAVFCGSIRVFFPDSPVAALAFISFSLLFSAILLSREHQLHGLAGLSFGAMLATAFGAFLFTICGAP